MNGVFTAARQNPSDIFHTRLSAKEKTIEK
jgi:hypothetical protein